MGWKIERNFVKMLPTTYRENLDFARCGNPECKEEHPAELFMHSQCHPEAPVTASYNNEDSTINIFCAECSSPIVKIKAASITEDLPDPYVNCDLHGINTGYVVCKHVLDGTAIFDKTKAEGGPGGIFCKDCVQKGMKRGILSLEKDCDLICGGHAIDQGFIPVEWFKPFVIGE
jgi:hypothetical protein